MVVQVRPGRSLWATQIRVVDGIRCCLRLTGYSISWPNILETSSFLCVGEKYGRLPMHEYHRFSLPEHCNWANIYRLEGECKTYCVCLLVTLFYSRPRITDISGDRPIQHRFIKDRGDQWTKCDILLRARSGPRRNNWINWNSSWMA